VGATGVELYKPWQYASGYVINRVGLGLDPNRMWASGVINLAGHTQSYDYRRQQVLDELAGTFSVAETWRAYDPGSGSHAIFDHEFHLATTENGLTRVAYAGLVKGLEQRDPTAGNLISTRYQNAVSGWNEVYPNLLANAQLYAGITLNPATLQRQVGINPVAGTISWSYDYDNRKAPSISGAISEDIVVTTRTGIDVFAELPIIARSAGPILQDMDTLESKKKSVQIEAVLPAAQYGGSVSPPNTDALVTSYAPSAASVFVAENEETWGERTGRYSRRTSWVYGN
jgi:hypothetical protein